MISEKIDSVMYAVSTVLFQEMVRHEYSSEEALKYWSRDGGLQARGAYFNLRDFKFCLFTKFMDGAWFIALELCNYEDEETGEWNGGDECIGYYRIHPETTCWEYPKIVGAIIALIDQYCPVLAGI